MPERNTVFDVDGKIYSRLAGSNRCAFHSMKFRRCSSMRCWRAKTRGFINIPELIGAHSPCPRPRHLSGSAKEGASSITQQLARNSLPLGGRNVSRKLLEAMVAFRIEHEFTKKQILELYVNGFISAPVVTVSKRPPSLLWKNASKLNLPEAALIAGLIRSPNGFRH